MDISKKPKRAGRARDVEQVLLEESRLSKGERPLQIMQKTAD